MSALPTGLDLIATARRCQAIADGIRSPQTQGFSSVALMIASRWDDAKAIEAGGAALLALDAANLEIARLKGVMRRVAASMGHSGGETPEYLPCNESCVDCDEDTIAESHRPDLPADCCSDHPDADGELDCWRCLLTAALTPKEPSDG